MSMYPKYVMEGKKPRLMTDEEMRKATEIDCSGDEPMTKQEFKDDADINVIVDRCLRHGAQLPVAVPPVFADCTQIPDFRGLQQRMLDVQDAFMLLPAKTRSFFDNDPVKAVEFVADEKNLDKAVELGLLAKRKEEPKPVPSEPKATPPTDTSAK